MKPHGPQRARPATMLVTSAAIVAFVVLEVSHHVADHAPALSATIDTCTTLCALGGVWLLHGQFRHTRRLRDLLFFVTLTVFALVTLTFCTLPVALQVQPGSSQGAATVGAALVAAMVLIAAFAPADRQLSADSRWVAAAVGTIVLAVALAALGGGLLQGVLDNAGSQPESGIAAATRHPLALPLALGTAIALILAAVGCARNRPSTDAGGMGLWAAAATLLAASSISYLALPPPSPNWVTPRDGLRLAGAALIFAAVLRQESRRRQAVARAAVIDERRRLARDLHDGLVQELAFISAHGDRLATDAGQQHPMAIAARRALAISRGAIADLSAVDAPTTGHALRHVADELSARYGISVHVQAEAVSVGISEREDIVRIAREAIVNAARHGAARNVTVSLKTEAGHTVLRVRDDGCGMGPDQQIAHAGFGLRSMSERAAALGGELVARELAEGGTELEVPVR